MPRPLSQPRIVVLVVIAMGVLFVAFRVAVREPAAADLFEPLRDGILLLVLAALGLKLTGGKGGLLRRLLGAASGEDEPKKPDPKAKETKP